MHIDSSTISNIDQFVHLACYRPSVLNFYRILTSIPTITVEDGQKIIKKNLGPAIVFLCENAVEAI